MVRIKPRILNLHMGEKHQCHGVSVRLCRPLILDAFSAKARCIICWTSSLTQGQCCPCPWTICLGTLMVPAQEHVLQLLFCVAPCFGIEGCCWSDGYSLAWDSSLEPFAICYKNNLLKLCHGYELGSNSSSWGPGLSSVLPTNLSLGHIPPTLSSHCCRHNRDLNIWSAWIFKILLIVSNSEINSLKPLFVYDTSTFHFWGALCKSTFILVW